MSCTVGDLRLEVGEDGMDVENDDDDCRRSCGVGVVEGADVRLDELVRGLRLHSGPMVERSTWIWVCFSEQRL